MTHLEKEKMSLELTTPATLGSSRRAMKREKTCPQVKLDFTKKRKWQALGSSPKDKRKRMRRTSWWPQVRRP